jgi:hypothetical protein
VRPCRALLPAAASNFLMIRYRLRRPTGTRPTPLAPRTKTLSAIDMNGDNQFAVCISNKGYAASLEVRKIYRLITDKAGARHGLVRVVDEMGEDYLFPEEYFVSLRLPQAAERALLRAN